MKFEDVMKLVNAGFSAEQIAGMMENPKKQEQEQEQEQEQKQDPTIADVLQQMKQIRQDMQNIALLGTKQKQDPKNSVDDILAAIINPQQKEGK